MEKLLIFALFDGTPIQLCVVKIVAELFRSAIFRQKNGNFSNLTEQFDTPHCPLRFVFVTFIFYKRTCKNRSLIG